MSKNKVTEYQRRRHISKYFLSLTLNIASMVVRRLRRCPTIDTVLICSPCVFTDNWTYLGAHVTVFSVYDEQ